ncbi:MAG: FdtA/QdtA family cupin domain-containing protein [Psychroserpens sp.]|uniref:sugar 3,4-ketoisomerase n=1 Tax=Psychroserpens sp. TaxID=2020870 RepID=UPI003C72365B
MSAINRVTIIEIPKVHDHRGKLAVVEKDVIPFLMKRIYYLFDVPSDAYRGGHAHKKQESLLIALSGSFEVVVNDGEHKKRVMLNKPTKGLFIPTGIWREIDNFSSGAICLVMASTEFTEDDYIRDFGDFVASKTGK